MRHQRAGVHLSRTSAHRKALFSNLVASLFTYERIRTTDAKAKATRRLAERTITWARRLGDVLTKEPDKRNDEEKARVVHAVRMARRVVRDRGAVVKLFDEIGPRYLGRHGGYTRIVKIGQRPGDAAPMSLLELIPDENAAARAPIEEGEAPEAKAEGKKKAAKADKGTATAKAEGKSAKPAGKSKAAPKASAKPAAKGDKGSASAKPAAKKPAAKKKPGK
jgi:large subunit ribosomal protein L17